MAYDSTIDTKRHIDDVRKLMYESASILLARGDNHDASKLESPEKEEFDRVTERLKTLKYGTDEYLESLKDLEVALKHHYENNSHHPNHYENGIDGMDIYDILEMLMDWSAAVNRTKEGNLYKSLEINEKRFNMSPQLANIFKNTIDRYKLAERKSD